MVFVRDGHIFSSGAGGSHLLPLVDLGDYLSPIWDLSGSEVVFLRRVGVGDGTSQIYMSSVDAQGENQSDLLSAAVSTGLIRSPNGSQVMFMTIVGGSLSAQQINIYSLDSGATFTIPFEGTGQFFSPSWGPTDTGIYVSELNGLNWDIAKYGVGGTASRTEVVSDPSNDTFPSVSPDGRLMAYFSDREGQARLFVRRLETGEDVKLTDLARTPRKTIWAPDSQRLAFVGGSQIYIIEPDGSDVRQVTTESSAYLLHSWSPDGKAIAYRANLIENPFGIDSYEFYAADVIGGEPVQLLDLAFDIDILWTTP